MGKQKYYDITELKEIDANYKAIIGERSNGKSYAVKLLCLQDALNDKGEFVYLRRYQIECTASKVEQYFADMDVKKMSKGKYDGISCFRNVIFFGKLDEDGKMKRVKRCGHVIYLSGATHFKSMAYPNVEHVIFEEFLTNEGYISDEITRFNSVISTIARRRKITVWMVGNTVSRLCPYIREWNLTNIFKQKPATIDVYDFETDEKDDDGNVVHVRVAVEYAPHESSNSKMFFGERSKMITSGVWEAKSMPHLEGSVDDYVTAGKILLESNGLSYVILILVKDDIALLYSYPYNKKRWSAELKKFDRIVTDIFDMSPKSTRKLTSYNKYDIIIKRLFEAGKACYSDNLTGTEVETILKGGV